MGGRGEDAPDRTAQLRQWPFIRRCCGRSNARDTDEPSIKLPRNTPSSYGCPQSAKSQPSISRSGSAIGSSASAKSRELTFYSGKSKNARVEPYSTSLATEPLIEAGQDIHGSFQRR